MAFGLSVVAMAYSTGPIAGAHLDAAVSLGFFVSGRMKTDDLVGYVVSQCGRDCRIGGYVSEKVSGAAVEAGHSCGRCPKAVGRRTSPNPRR